MNLVNCTPHAINLNDGTTYPPSGTVARVETVYNLVGDNDSPLLFTQHYGDITGLPDYADGQFLIVSAIVHQAAKKIGRGDCLAPATGHPDVRRNEKGQIVSVPGLVV